MVAIPANEIVIPTILMLTALLFPSVAAGEGAGVMFELGAGGTGESSSDWPDGQHSPV